MKRIYNILCAAWVISVSAIMLSSCNNYDLKVDNSFYDNVKITVEGTRNDTLYINLVNQQQITLEVEPEDLVFDMRAFTYTLSDTTVVKIDASGNIVPLKVGTTELTLVFRANNKVRTSCKIDIWRDLVYITRVIAPDISIKLTGGDYDLKSNVTVVPSNADNQVLAYESLTPGILSVDANGIITPLAEGQGQVKITSTDGTNISTVCNVNVVPSVKVAEVQIPAKLDGATMGVGQIIDLPSVVTVLPANADELNLTYSVISGSNVVSVDTNGKLTALAVGTATVHMETKDGTGIAHDVNLVVTNTTLFQRATWGIFTITDTNYGNATDGATGLPQHLIDGSTTTYLALVKPGKSYGSVGMQSKTFLPAFVIDMKYLQTFNYFTWQHRSSNNANYLRVFAVNVYGSNDNQNYIQLNTGGYIWIPNTAGYVGTVSKLDTETYNIDVPKSTYRYVKVELAVWSDIYNSTNSNYPGTGSTTGSTMQMAEFGLGNK